MSPAISAQTLGNVLVVCLVLMLFAVIAVAIREGWEVVGRKLDEAAADLPNEDEQRHLDYLAALRPEPETPIANQLIKDWPAIECRATFGRWLCARPIGHAGEHNDGAMHWTGEGLRLVDPFDPAEDAAWNQTMNDRPGGGVA